jgi:hypothetical protein
VTIAIDVGKLYAGRKASSQVACCRARHRDRTDKFPVPVCRSGGKGLSYAFDCAASSPRMGDDLIGGSRLVHRAPPVSTHSFACDLDRMTMSLGKEEFPNTRTRSPSMRRQAQRKCASLMILKPVCLMAIIGGPDRN